jgi:hypothetical protein
MSNKARFQRNQKVTATYGDTYIVTHPFPDDFNMITVRSDDDEREYVVFDQNNLTPVIPDLGLTVEWKVPQAGEFVVQQGADGSLSIYRASERNASAFVIVNITEREQQ